MPAVVTDAFSTARSASGTLRPAHTVGAYYFWLRTRQPNWWRELLWRPFRSVRTRHHLRNPWWIPLTLLAELRGFLAACVLVRRGPRLLQPHD